VRSLVVAEARRQGSTLSEAELIDVFALDIELNAQGLSVWLEQAR
jgi:hypothetical protein